MNLWEVVVSIFILTVAVPLIVLSESNIVHVIQTGRMEIGRQMVAMTVINDQAAGSDIPQTMVEGGVTYRITSTNTAMGGCHGTEVQIVSLTPVTRRDHFFIPNCESGIFAH